jgi:membrane-bound lytic murein transglycosylase A
LFTRPVVWALAAVLALAACASPRQGPAPGPIPTPTPAPQPPPPPPAPPVEPDLGAAVLPLEALKGWADEDHAEALAAFVETCAASRDYALAAVCREARAQGRLAEPDAKRFLESRLRARRLPSEGVLTAYFAPEYEARMAPDAEFSAPVRPKPLDLKVADGGVFQVGPGGVLAPYPDRTAIETSSLVEPPVAWMRPEELFFLQIQGSGVLTFADGHRMKALYAANNGRPFVGVANPMRDQGLLARDNTSGEAIRAWLAAHRGPDADAIMRLNPRYAFFSLAPDDGRQPVGAAGVPLPSGRAVAVDLSLHTLGEVFWIDAEAPILTGAFPVYRRMVTGLDTGGAIKGEVRADLYLGQGAVAGLEAGRVRHTLRMYRLVAAYP